MHIPHVYGDVHVPQDTRNTKGRGYSGHWLRVRKYHLAASPLCVMCFARGWTVPATDVDHITPLSRGGTNDPANLQSLCHSCHSSKTGRERKGQNRHVTKNALEARRDAQ